MFDFIQNFNVILTQIKYRLKSDIKFLLRI